MNRLNHQHLFYFWTVAKEGSVAEACKQLCLAQPTVSGQVIQFERDLGKTLFDRRGRRMILTNDGRVVLAHAEKIFSQSRALLAALKNNSQKQLMLRIGIDADVSKQAALKVLEEALAHESRLHVQIEEGHLRALLDRLRRFSLDLVLSSQDGMIGDGSDFVRSEIARLDILFVAVPSMARRVKSFPKGLSAIPLAIPSRSSPLWEPVQHFLLQHTIIPSTIVEIQDAGLLRQTAVSGLAAACLSSIAVDTDLKQGILVKLGHASTGIKKTLWLTAHKDYDRDSVIDSLMTNFSI
jgi:LysR family transcriptional activator of nhaA